MDERTYPMNVSNTACHTQQIYASYIKKLLEQGILYHEYCN